LKVHRSTESVILEVFLFFCACLLFCWQLYSHISPLPHPMFLSYYLLAHHPACPLSQVTIIWKGFHLCIGDSPSLSWAWWRHLRLTRGSPDSICLRSLRARRHLYHAGPRPHISPRTHTTPLHATTLTPTSSPPTQLHLIAISILAINCLSGTCHWASPQQPLRTELPSTSTQPTPSTPANTRHPHPLAKYTKDSWLYPPPPLTKERSSMGRVQAPHRLVSLFYPLFIWSRLYA